MDVVGRLKPDPENWPAGLRDELRALAARSAHLAPAERQQLALAALSPRAWAQLRDQERRARIAYRLLTGELPPGQRADAAGRA